MYCPQDQLKYSNYSNQEHLKQGLIFNKVHRKLEKNLKTFHCFHHIKSTTHDYNMVLEHANPFQCTHNEKSLN